MRICATSPEQAEFSLCGDSFDIHLTEKDEEQFEFVKPGQTVTCERCRKSIDEIRNSYPKGYKLK